ncbi:MAG TPA: peptidoglycan-associated lipoprotein Pal, partial [Candidatus Binataceae bacterium]|nr:peptidoglycan-associated lipoprotein Pal [Candidatus Binataceae bacterium]
WVSRVSVPVRISAAMMLFALLALSGCASKQPAPIGGPGAGNGNQPGLNEETTGKTSLEKFQSGTLGGGSGGPLTDIHFDYDEFTIRQQDGGILRSNAQWLQQHPGTHVQVEGHCDERGSEEYNIALGAKRAQAAKEYLVTLGIADDRISTISYGKELPLCTEHDESCWAQNRRAHFVVSK